MASPAIVNASPLIFLARAGLISLLQEAGDPIVVPRAVADEIQRRGPSDQTVQAMQQASWLEIIDDPPISNTIQAWDLGPGESAVLACAQATAGAEAIIDDLAGRRCAEALGIPIRGTLGLVLLAKQRGSIVAARPILEQLRATGMYLSNRVLNEVAIGGRVTAVAASPERRRRHICC